MGKKVVIDFLEGKVTFLTAESGEHYRGRNDLLLVGFTQTARVAMLTTRSTIVAAPVVWCREKYVARVGARALLVNAGNANCYTGSAGMENVRVMAQKAADTSQCSLEETWVCSTGVIGEPLRMKPLLKGIDALRPCSLEEGAKAILTTDTKPKIAQQNKMRAISKGIGMMAPNMATMLCFVFIDGGFPQALLEEGLKKATDKTLNRIHIDGDTSTNDTILLFDVGDTNKPSIAKEDFEPTLTALLEDIAKQHVCDGEGSSKVLQLTITQAASEEEARVVFRAVAGSLLVKTALAGGDPNWGRLIAAVGKSQIPIDPQRLEIFIGTQQVTENGTVHKDYHEETARKTFAQPLVEITIALGRGDISYQGWGCDLTEGYIRINADYRS